jgi:dCMP deaminase
MKERVNKEIYYLDIAESVLERSTCLKRKYGSVIVNNDEVISSGYSGAPRKIQDCIKRGYCFREHSERGTDYSNCLSVHSEMNAIISASRKDMIGATLYLVGVDSNSNEYVKNPSPCCLCKRMIKNAGIENVIVRLSKDKYRVINVSEWTDKDFVGGY